MNASHGKLAGLLLCVVCAALTTEACTPSGPTPAPTSVEPPPTVEVIRQETAAPVPEVGFTLVPAAGFVLTSYGGTWDKDRLDAVLYGLPVKGLKLDHPDRSIEDIRAEIKYDPGTAKVLAEKAGLSRLTFVTPQGDSASLVLAKRMVEPLSGLGIRVDVLASPEYRTVLEQMTAAGEPALGLWRR